MSLIVVSIAFAQDKRIFKIFQLPPSMIPLVGGKYDNWKAVVDDYTIGIDQLWYDSKKHTAIDPEKS